MYDVSQEYKTAIRRQTRMFEWQGTITTTAGKVYHFTTKDIVKGSGTLTRSCAGSTSLELGSVYAAELDISLFLDVDRYSLYDAVIDLNFVCRHSVKRVWNDLRPFTWGAMRTKRWNDRGDTETIPMGKFVVSEATRTLTILQLKAYDYMLKFDKSMKNSGTVRTPFEWLKYACESCQVPLGVTEEAVAAMPNGTQSLSWTNLDEDKTWRDLIAQVATVLCGVCQIDRSGALVVIPFSNTPVMDIPASWRYSSKIADYITKYTGLYATYRAGGLTEYYHVEPDDGLIYNIGTNPLLQIAATSLRSEILQGIIDIPTRCDCRIVREVEAQRAVVMAFNTLPSRREELVVQRERLLTGEIGRIDALLKTLDGQQDRLEERLEVLASQVPEDGEAINTTVVDEVGSTQVITSEMDEAAFLRSQIVEIRRRKDGLYAERAEHANTEVQIRLLLELVDEMVKNSLPEWMTREAETVEETGACRDYDDFFRRTKYTVPEGVLDENGRMEAFNTDLVIRYLDRVVVKDDGYEVAFKAGVSVEVEI